MSDFGYKIIPSLVVVAWVIGHVWLYAYCLHRFDFWGGWAFMPIFLSHIFVVLAPIFVAALAHEKKDV